MTGNARPGDRAQAVIGLILAQLFFGVHYFAAKIVLEEIPPRTWAVLRATAATMVLLLLVRALRRRLPGSATDYGRLALFSLFGVVINQVCFIEGLSRTTATHSSIIITGIPVGTLLFAVLLGRETLTVYKVLSLVVSSAGLVLVIRPDALLASSSSLQGDLLTLVNALSYSFFLVISKRLLTRVDPVPATAVLMGFGSIGILIVGWSELVRFEPALISTRTWSWGLYVVIFPTAFAYLINYWALRRVNPSVVAVFIYLQPVIATGLAVAFLGERPGLSVLVGASLIFAGVHLALRPAPDSKAIA